MPTLTWISTHDLTIDIGEMPIRVHADSPEFAHMLRDRYGEFVDADAPNARMELEIELVKEPELAAGGSGSGRDRDAHADLSVRVEAGRWVMERGDFRAEWDPQCHRGWVRQSVNPYAIDGVLRILHSLILARQGGFLVHAASAVRNGRAFVFAGVSGVGKTTLARLAPPDVTLLTDEISYVRPAEQVSGAQCQVPDGSYAATAASSLAPDTRHLTPAFSAFGTPFAGELAKIGHKVRAPLAALFLLKQGPENRIEPVSAAEATRELLGHVLFFAHDQELVLMVFNTICAFVKRVPVRRLVFTKDARVWELIA